MEEEDPKDLELHSHATVIEFSFPDNNPPPEAAFAFSDKVLRSARSLKTCKVTKFQTDFTVVFQSRP